MSRKAAFKRLFFFQAALAWIFENMVLKSKYGRFFVGAGLKMGKRGRKGRAVSRWVECWRL